MSAFFVGLLFIVMAIFFVYLLIGAYALLKTFFPSFSRRKKVFTYKDVPKRDLKSHDIRPVRGIEPIFQNMKIQDFYVGLEFFLIDSRKYSYKVVAVRGIHVDAIRVQDGLEYTFTVRGVCRE